MLFYLFKISRNTLIDSKNIIIIYNFYNFIKITFFNNLGTTHLWVAPHWKCESN